MGFLDLILGKPSHLPEKVGEEIDSFIEGIMKEIGRHNSSAQRELISHKFFIGLLIDKIERDYGIYAEYEQNSVEIYSQKKAEGLTTNITFYEYTVSCLNHVDNHDAFIVNEFFNSISYLLIKDEIKNNIHPGLVMHPLWLNMPFGYFSQMGDEYAGVVVFNDKSNLQWIINHINDPSTIYRF